MTTLQTSLLVLAVALVAVVAFWQRRRRNIAEPSADLPLGPEHGVASTPNRLEGLRVMDGDSEVFSMRVLDDDQSATLMSSEMVAASPSVVTALSAFTQAVPSAAAAARIQSKRLMEVVINGNLVRASDGNGWRAFSMGKDGIRENARLFEAVGTKGLAIASAAWQVLAVVVGQKYMADISHQLNSIEEKIDRIAAFLDQQRLARIKAAYRYIKAAYEELRERPPSQQVLNQLESIWVQLDEISTHLHMEIEATFQQKQREGSFGSSDEFESACARLDSLENSILALDACIQARLASWYLGWLHPQGERFLQKRREIEDDLEKLLNVREKVAAVSLADIHGIEAFWNSRDTLRARQADVAGRAKALIGKHKEMWQREFAMAERVFGVAEESAHPLKLVAEIRDGEIIAAYLPAVHIASELPAKGIGEKQVFSGGRPL